MTCSPALLMLALHIILNQDVTNDSAELRNLKKQIYSLAYSCEHMTRVHLVRNHAGVLSGNTVKGEGYW